MTPNRVRQLPEMSTLALPTTDIFTAYVPMPSYSTVPVAIDSVSCGKVNS